MDEMPNWAVRMDGKLDVLLARGEDHEKRLRSVESEKWLHRGGLAVVSLLAYKMGWPTWFHS